jgi:uncharacterized 2Fe-2S/4Fe-4S cluster protein (DUF4445 family)
MRVPLDAAGVAVVPEADGGAEALVVFTPSGRRGRFPVGTPLLQAARSLGVDVDSVCGGRALCGRCQVTLAEGDFTKHGLVSRPEHLSGTSEDEHEYVAQGGKLVDGRRLACSTLIRGDVVIDVPPDSQVHRQVVRKRAEIHDIDLDAGVRPYYVEVQQPDMHEPAGDLRRLYEALEFEWGLTDVGECDFHVLRGLQRALRDGDWKVTAAVRNDRRIVGVWPRVVDEVYGVAVDIGSTTIAAHLCSLRSGEVLASSGVMNPQIRFGEDLMSRVSYIMMHPGSDAEMTAVVRSAINDLIVAVAEEAQAPTDAILDITMVGNPIMHHLILGIDPIELGGAPFALTTDDAVTIPASELGLDVHPGARVYVLPCVAGHVGADTAGVMLSEQPHLVDAVTLLVDVGTNAEIVLGNKERLLACSSPTGPAFEGAQITGGQRAAPGAIERVRIDRETLEPKFRVIGCELWSDEPGFAQGVAETGINGICGSGIIEVIAEMFLAGIITTDGVIRADLTERSTRMIEDGRTFAYQLHTGTTDIRITQNDVRAIQLAKAALYAGVRLLMDRLHVDHVDRVRLAGAFGSHIDVKYAMVLGLIPDCALEHVTSAGNAAGTGARIALLDFKSRDEIESLVRRVEKIETAVEPRFQDHFVAAMAIPHKTASFDHLAKVVDLPARTDGLGDQSENQGEGGRRRRRRKRS